MSPRQRVIVLPFFCCTFASLLHPTKFKAPCRPYTKTFDDLAAAVDLFVRVFRIEDCLTFRVASVCLLLEQSAAAWLTLCLRTVKMVHYPKRNKAPGRIHLGAGATANQEADPTARFTGWKSSKMCSNREAALHKKITVSATLASRRRGE